MRFPSPSFAEDVYEVVAEKKTNDWAHGGALMICPIVWVIQL